MNDKQDGRGAVTLKDVARRAGVHPGTASRALNAETRPMVKGQTAERVLAIAEELGYSPNPIARGLKTSRSYTVGVLIPDLTNPLFPPIVRGIQDRLEDAAYTPLIANTDNDPYRERAGLHAMQARQVDGLITATAHRTEVLQAELAEVEIPTVLVNRRLDGTGVSSVVADDIAGVALAVEHLVALGHRRIAHLAGPQDVSTGYLRLEGFKQAMTRAKIEADPELILIGNAFVENEGARLCAELLDYKADFSAIIAGNDLMALGCYRELFRREVDCPREVSVVGYNDMPFAEWFNPPLTTVHLPHYVIGKRAAELLLERIRDPQANPEQVTLAPSFTVRGSTAAPDTGRS